MQKTVCDLCGEDAINGDFILPKYEDRVLMHKGHEYAKIYVGIKLNKINLCHKHALCIADWIDTFDNSEHTI